MKPKRIEIIIMGSALSNVEPGLLDVMEIIPSKKTTWEALQARIDIFKGYALKVYRPKCQTFKIEITEEY